MKYCPVSVPRFTRSDQVEGSKNRELKAFLTDFGGARLVLKVLDDNFRSTF